MGNEVPLPGDTICICSIEYEVVSCEEYSRNRGKDLPNDTIFTVKCELINRTAYYPVYRNTKFTIVRQARPPMLDEYSRMVGEMYEN